MRPRNSEEFKLLFGERRRVLFTLLIAAEGERAALEYSFCID
jgi:hypothetical protein